MELWIRNQDRENLVKVELLEINEREKDYIIITMFQNKVAHLGIYKTKERALEVLDEIEDKLINCTFAKKQNGLGEVLDFMPNSIYVYEMPKE